MNEMYVKTISIQYCTISLYFINFHQVTQGNKVIESQA